MFSQIRNLWKSVSGPMMKSQLKIQNGRTDIAKIGSKHFSGLSSQSTLCPTPNQASAVAVQKPLLFTTPVTFQSVRTKVRVYYRGSAWLRYNKHNIEKRLTTPGGLEILWRRTLKGRHQLAVYERILPNTVNSKILPDSHFKYTAHPVTKRRLPKPGLY